MSTRRTFLKTAAAAGVAALTSAPSVRAAPRIKHVMRREDTILRYPFVGDNWHMSWAADDRQYVSLCDGFGAAERPQGTINSRLYAIEGGPHELKFHDLPGYPVLSEPMQGRYDPRYYNFGTLALDGYLYQFLSTFNRPMSLPGGRKPEPEDWLRFNGAKLIYSPDQGRTWCNQNGSTPVVWEDWQHRSQETLVFFNEDQDAFSLLTVLQMGKNYRENKDGYVYVYAPNGNTDGTMNELVMFRVPKGKLLQRSAYEYFAGLQGNGNARWRQDILARKPIHTFPRGWVNTPLHPYAWHPSVVYNAPLGLYLMANWGMGTNARGEMFGKPSYLGFWISQTPWGPWTQIHEETAWLPGGEESARAYEPQIAPKWIAPDGKSFWLVWTDHQVKGDTEAFDGFMKEFVDKKSRDQLTAEDWARRVAMKRKHQPYYSFNVQRVDLMIA